MANEKRLVDIGSFPLLPTKLEGDLSEYERGYLDAQENMNCLPTVDAVELPQGKPGDYLEWDNGAGFRQIYGIVSVNFCFDGTVRYDIECAQPVINHPGIVRILTAEEAKREWEERCAKEGFPKEEPTFTACKEVGGRDAK